MLLPPTPRWRQLRPHPVQQKLWDSPHRFNVVPAGRRSGKTELAKRKLVTKAMLGTEFDNPRFFAAAPIRDQAKRIYWSDLKALVPDWMKAKPPSETDLIIWLINDAEIHVVGMDKPARIEGSPWDGGILDEYGNMKAGAWGENIRPAFADRRGWCDIIGVPEGRNHYYDLDVRARAEMALHGDKSEWGSFTWFSSDILPASEIEAAKRDLPPKVFQQEYEGSFVDFSGDEFFDIGKMLDADGKPVPLPEFADCVFATIDCAVKDGKEHDGTAVVFWASSEHVGHKLTVLDWDIVQVEGAVLESWLPSVFQRLHEFTNLIRCRAGSVGAYIEDASAGSILLQQARLRGWPAMEIDSILTSAGKDGRAFSVSGYVHRGDVKITQHAYDKTVQFKDYARNHLLSQISGFRIGDPDAYKRSDDLFDAWVYGIIISLGNAEGF